MFQNMISYDDFAKLDIRVGKILVVEDFKEARKPAYKLTIDFGPEIGIKRSSAQITRLYGKQDLMGTFVMAVVNFPPKRVGPFISEVLTLGFEDEEGNIVLAKPDSGTYPGARLF